MDVQSTKLPCLTCTCTLLDKLVRHMRLTHSHPCAGGPHVPSTPVQSPCGPQREHLCSSQPWADTRDLRYITWHRGFLHSYIFLQVIEEITDIQRVRVFWCLLHFLRLLQGLHSAWHYRNAHTRLNSGVGPSYTGTEKHIVAAVVWYMGTAEAARTMRVQGEH